MCLTHKQVIRYNVYVTMTYIYRHSYSGPFYRGTLNSWLAEIGVRGSKSCPATSIEEMWYFRFSSRDMTENVRNTHLTEVKYTERPNQALVYYENEGF